MDDLEQERINEQLVDLAIRESTQEANKQSCLIKRNRNETNSEYFTTIMTAIQIGDMRTLQVLSCCAYAFSECDSSGRLPVHVAAAQPDQAVLHLVLLASTELTLEEQTDDGDTALTLAAEADLVDNVKMLIQYGASPHNLNGRNESALLIAVRQKSYEMVSTLVISGAFVGQLCLHKWTAVHEAAKVGCPAILKLLIRHGARVSVKGRQGVTPLGVAAAHGNTAVLHILIMNGCNVNAQTNNGDSVLCDAAGSGNLDCVDLLLQYRANPNIASHACQLPIHRAAYEGHIETLRTLIIYTLKRAIRLSGHSPVHSAADAGHVDCLQLLIDEGYDVNALLDAHISGVNLIAENYGDMRKTPLYFAVSNGHVTCAEMLLAAGAKTDLDPLPCILVAIRAESYELVQLLLSYGAEVNCYFNMVNDTMFPTALQYCLKDPAMLRLVLNGGYQAYKCFQCNHGDFGDDDDTLDEADHKGYEVYCRPDVVSFCEFVTVSWLAHVIGSVVRTLLDYVGYIRMCPHLTRALERRPEWEEISDILGKPRPLQHLCRQVIRGRMRHKTLNNPKAMTAVPFPPALKKYLTYRNYALLADGKVITF